MIRGVMLLAGLFLIGAGIDQYAALQIGKIARIERGRDARLQPLVDMRMDPSQDGEQASAFGYIFRLPRKPNPPDPRTSVSYMRLFANNSGGIIIFDPATNLTYGMLQQQGLCNVLLGECSSKYELAKLQMQVTADDLSVFHLPSRNRAIALLLLDKPHLGGNIYSLAFGNMRGFELTDKNGVPSILRLFDGGDTELEIILPHAKSGVDPAWTQPRVNAFIASIHRAAPNEVKP